MAEFVMPSLGSDMESGTVVEWMVKPGDTVKRGDIVAAIETAKGVIDIEIFSDGTIEKILVPVGEEVPVGTLLATYAAKGEVAGAMEAPPPPAEMPATAKVEAATPKVTAPAPRAGGAARVSPAARKLAREAGIDVEQLRGTGPGGSITSEDVKLASAGKKPGRGPRTMRESIAAAMSRSKREIPHYYVASDIDLGKALDWLATANAERPVKSRLLPAILLTKAVALTLREVPELNGFYTDNRVQLSDQIHIGSAISLKREGLIAPAIHDTDTLTLDELMAATASLIERSRKGGLRGSEMSDATITISNLGERGVDSLLGIIYPPQLALVGFGRIREQPVAIEGSVVVRPVITASLAADHRATDGYHGSRFLRLLSDRLQRPDTL